MKQTTVHILDMLKRITRFILENAITPPIARVTELTAEINTVIAGVEGAARDQVDGSGNASGGVGTRKEKSAALRRYMKDVARVARTLDRDAHPGLAEQFRLPRSRGYPALIATATTMIADATPLEAEFVAHGLPATFLADLAALLAAFGSGTDAKIDGRLTQVGGTSGLKHGAADGMEAAQKLDAIIRAHFRDDPVKLEMWTHARHVQVNPERSPDEPETAPGSGEGSGA